MLYVIDYMTRTIYPPYMNVICYELYDKNNMSSIYECDMNYMVRTICHPYECFLWFNSSLPHKIIKKVVKFGKICHKFQKLS